MWTGSPHYWLLGLFFEVKKDMVRRLMFILSLAAVLAALNGCGDDNPVKPTDPAPVILDVQSPEKFWAGVNTFVLISATVTDAQGLANIDSVTLTVLKPDSLTIVFHATLNDSALNGDLVPFDGVYSSLIHISFTENNTGTCYFQFQATDFDDNQSRVTVRTVLVVSEAMNEPPEIVEIILPEILSVDASIQYSFNVRASDPQGIDDLDAVVFRVHNQENPRVIRTDTLRDNGVEPDAKAMDGLFTGTFTSGFADSVVGVYPFSFQAFDKGGDSTDLVRRDVKVINESNAPPVIFNLSAPDTFDSKSSTNFFTVTLEVMDPQGLSDVDSVYFYSRKPDGTMANRGLPILMVDDGTFGDVRAGDGIYSFKAIFDPSAQKGDYTWTFNAVDRSGARSNIIVHILTII
jgi:hypothetical protein